MSKFFCETNCELWYTRADQLNINVIQMPYTIEGKEYYYDLGRNTDFKEFYAKVRSGIVPITSALNPQNYYELFEPVLKGGEDILYVTFSHGMSNTFEYMQQAIDRLKQEYPDRKITIFDTGSISMGAGYQVYYAAKMHADGATDEEIVQFLSGFKQHVALYFMVDDLIHLKRGGRISPAMANIGKFFNLKPILTVNKEGMLTTFTKVSGRRAALAAMIKTMVASEVDTDYPIVLIDGDEEELRDEFAQKIKEQFPTAQFWTQPIGPVVGTHCGPGTIGVIYYKKKP